MMVYVMKMNPAILKDQTKTPMEMTTVMKQTHTEQKATTNLILAKVPKTIVSPIQGNHESMSRIWMKLSLLLLITW
jgi:hypothetical protein